MLVLTQSFELEIISGDQNELIMRNFWRAACNEITGQLNIERTMLQSAYMLVFNSKCAECNRLLPADNDAWRRHDIETISALLVGFNRI